MYEQYSAKMQDAPYSDDLAYNHEQWRLRSMRYVYQAGIQVFPDYPLQVFDIIFVACPMNTAIEAQLAFAVLREKTQSLLAQINQSRVAFLVDIAGLSIGSDTTPHWGGMLKQFLQDVCLEIHPGTDQFMIARYNSQTDITLNPQQRATSIADRIRNIQIMSEGAAHNFQSNILGSRQEAIELITILRTGGRRGTSPKGGL